MASQKKQLNISTSGVQSQLTLIEPGVTVFDGNIEDRYIEIHIIDINLKLSGAGIVTLFVGGQQIFEQQLTAAGTINVYGADLYASSKPVGILSISVSTSIDVTGYLGWTKKFAGGSVVTNS